MSFTPEQLRALGRTASPPEPLPEQRPYCYERAVELLAQTTAMLAHRTREPRGRYRGAAAYVAAVVALTESRMSR